MSGKTRQRKSALSSEIALRRVVVVVVRSDIARGKCFNNVEDVGRAGRIGLLATFVRERS